MTKEFTTYAVDPARLAPGEWDHALEKTIGRGDIAASYSADRIGMGQPVRRPFSWLGSLWVCVSSAYNSPYPFEAYRLAHPDAFSGEPTTYHEKLQDGDAARADPMGFYHGMTVKCAGERLIMCGPPALFVAGVTEQLDLFG